MSCCEEDAKIPSTENPLHKMIHASKIANDRPFLPQFSDIESHEQFVRPIDLSATKFYKTLSINDAIGIMANSALNAIFQVLDIISDFYLAVSLFTDEAYIDVSDSAKLAFVLLLFLSMLFTIGMSLVMTCTHVMDMSLLRSFSKDTRTTCTQRCMTLFSTFIMMFFGLPTHLAAFGRIVKVAGNNIVLMYDSKDEYKASKKITLLASHTWVLFLEDFPLFIINLYIAGATDTFTFSAIVALMFTCISLFVKFEYIYRFYKEMRRTGDTKKEHASGIASNKAVFESWLYWANE